MSAPGSSALELAFCRFLYTDALPLLIFAYAANSAVRLENE